MSTACKLENMLDNESERNAGDYEFSLDNYIRARETAMYDIREVLRKIGSYMPKHENQNVYNIIQLQKCCDALTRI